MGLFVHMRRSLPSNGDLGRRCQAVAAVVTAWFWEAVTGKRPGLGFLVVSSPPGGPESYALTQGPDDVLPMLRQAAETGARLEVLPLQPALQPLMVALARERFRGVGHVRAGRSGASAGP